MVKKTTKVEKPKINIWIEKEIFGSGLGYIVTLVSKKDSKETTIRLARSEQGAFNLVCYREANAELVFKNPKAARQWLLEVEDLIGQCEEGLNDKTTNP